MEKEEKGEWWKVEWECSNVTIQRHFLLSHVLREWRGRPDEIGDTEIKPAKILMREAVRKATRTSSFRGRLPRSSRTGTREVAGHSIKVFRLSQLQ